MKGFTIVCNSCGNNLKLDQGMNKRHNQELSITIHSYVECGLICNKCEEKIILNDNEN